MLYKLNRGFTGRTSVANQPVYNERETHMYSLESYVDVFQQTKKKVTDKVITDPNLNKAAHNFIDAQTIFAKMLIANTQDMAKYAFDNHTSFWMPSKDKK